MMVLPPGCATLPEAYVTRQTATDVRRDADKYSDHLLIGEAGVRHYPIDDESIDSLRARSHGWTRDERESYRMHFLRRGRNLLVELNGGDPVDHGDVIVTHEEYAQ